MLWNCIIIRYNKKIKGLTLAESQLESSSLSNEVAEMLFLAKLLIDSKSLIGCTESYSFGRIIDGKTELVGPDKSGTSSPFRESLSPSLDCFRQIEKVNVL